MAGGSDTVDHGSVKARGWRQGSVLPKALVDELRKDTSLPTYVSPSDIVFVLSHDCDVTHDSFESEPWVEVIPAKVIPDAERDGNFAFGKNPRKYQFDLPDSTPVLCQLNVHELFRFPRTRLNEFSPDEQTKLPREELKRVCRWIAMRYTRAAFPDAFNERIRPAMARLRKKFKTKGHLLSGLYVLCVDDELDDGDSYTIVVKATMPVDQYETPHNRTAAQALLDSFVAEVGSCAGIDLDEGGDDVELVSERDFSLDDLLSMKRLDFDDLTLRDESTTELPPV